MAEKPSLPSRFACGAFKKYTIDSRLFERGVLLHELFKKHYAPHANRHFYADLCKDMSEGEVEVWWVTSPEQSSEELLEEIRGVIMPFVRLTTGKSQRHNSIHVSDSIEEARRERGVWF